MRWIFRSSPCQVQPKTIKLAFVASPRSIKEKEKDWVDQNRENVSEWGDNTDFVLLLSYNVSTHNSTPNHEEQILAGSETLTRRVHCI